MNEYLVIDLGNAKDVTKSPHEEGCVQDGVNPIRYQRLPSECP